MKQKNISILGLLIAFYLAGCSTVEPGKRYGNLPLDSMKTAYVVLRKEYDPQIGAHIQEALSQHGVTASTGMLPEKPKNVAFFVEYEDHWRWDLAMYLHSLDIRFIDNSTGQLIGAGSFRQGVFHDFPNAKEKTFNVVESIYLGK